MLEGFQRGLLNRVLGIFGVMRDVVGDSEKFAIVSLYELLESSYIPILAGMDKIQVIACHLPPTNCAEFAVISVRSVSEDNHFAAAARCYEWKAVSVVRHLEV